MKNTHLSQASKHSVSGMTPGSLHRDLEFSGQPNRPIKRTFSKTRLSEESEDTTIRRNPNKPTEPLEESDNTRRTHRKTDREEDRRETTLSGLERLKRHREEVAGRVSIPESWGKEGLLENWTDFSAFDSAFTSNQIFSARAALMADSSAASGRGVSRQRLRIESSC